MLTQCKCIIPHSWEGFAETSTFKENIWRSLLQEINFMVFLSCSYKKLERILSRQSCSGEWTHSCVGFTNVLHMLILKSKEEQKGEKSNTKTFSPLIFQIMRIFPGFFVQ